MNGLRAQWLGCSDFLAARGLSATPAARAAFQRVLSQGGPPATERACDKSYAMPFALAMLFVLFLAATASAQSVLDDKGRVYPCVPYEPNCAFPSARTPLQPWPFDPLRYRKHIPPPPFLGARPPVPYIPAPSMERAPQ